MVALRLGAQVGLHRGLAGWPVHTRGVVVGVGHARGGQFGQHRVQAGAGLGIQQPADFTHPVGLLLAYGEVAPPGPLGIAQRAVGVEQGRQPVGSLPQPVGGVLAGHPRQRRLGGLPGLIVHAVGQLPKELADDPHVLGADLPARLGGRGVGHLRWQWLAAQRGAGTEVLGLGDASARLSC